jgi:DNA polymerase elongation subunit (family B)
MVLLQIVDIIPDDIPGSNDNKLFQISIYGKTIDSHNTQKSIICHIVDFKPYFYLKIPEEWTHGHVIRFLKDIDGNIETLITCIKNYDPTKDLLEPKQRDIVSYKELYGFRCDEHKEQLTYQFVKLRFSSHTAMSKYSEAIRKKYSILKRQTNNHYDLLYRQWISLDKDDNCDSHLYESNIHPMLRFIHYSNIQPAGWIQIDYDDNELSNHGLYPHIDYVLDDINYKDVKPYENESISPFIIASYDIECDSSHGDFPQANKDMKKLAIDIYDSFVNLSPDMYSHLVKPCLKYAFQIPLDIPLQDYHKNLDINLVYTKGDKQPCEDSIQSIQHLCKQESFISRFSEKKQRDPIIKQLTQCLNIMVDSEGNYLQVEGDKVIQIGTVFHRYGEASPYKRHILVIAPQDNLSDEEICSDLENIEVIRCKNEKQLLLGWKDIIKQEDPDYVTGYNTFGFDFAYMIDRMRVYCKCKGKWCNKWCPLNKFMNMGKINSIHAYYHRNKKCKEIKKKTSTFGSLDYLRYIHMDGRIIYDLQKEIEKGHNLESYKLDNVAAHFMRGKLKSIDSVAKTHDEMIVFSTKLYTQDFGNLKKGDYISLRLHSNIGETYFKDNKKYKINDLISQGIQSYISITSGYILFHEKVHERFYRHSTWTPDTSEYFKIEWCLMKDDVSPQDIFEKHKSGGPDGRAEVAKYCIQDCELCINLTLALDIIPNNIAMANVCWVPQSYIYLRGQGAKIFSLISKECNKHNFRIPTLVQPFTGHEYIKMYQTFTGEPHEKREQMKDHLIKEKYQEWYGPEWKTNYDDDLKQESNWKPYKEYSIEDELDIITTDNPPPRVGYEGAIVLDPEPGIYLDDPVGVVDYASLYPSSILEKNISHDTLIEDPKYLEYLDPDEYETITYDNYIYEEEEGKITISKKRSVTNPTITCHYLKKQEGKPAGIIPTVVKQLLDQRKATKNRLKHETNEFKKGVLESLQLAYKLVANSVYGQTGARTSPVYKNILAASTTAIGRERIYDAKRGVEERWWKESEWAIKHKCRPPKVIYGDTDSVFIKWQRFKNDVELTGKEALEFCIECGKDAGEWVTQHMLHKPQDLEYEKTLYPFILISKKRYVADLFEFDINSCKRKSMGIVLKRRDNAPIVKHVFGNVIEKIMIDKDLDKAVDWLKQTLADIMAGNYPISYFIITKSLRGYYKNPGSIAHKVLADRIGERDPGNKPKAGDRIPYVYHKVDEDPIYLGTYKNGKPKYKKRNILQGDRIEDPEYVQKNNKEIDYKFYITNQIMNPVKQVLDLELDEKETELIFKI